VPASLNSFLPRATALGVRHVLLNGEDDLVDDGSAAAVQGESSGLGWRVLSSSVCVIWVESAVVVLNGMDRLGESLVRFGPARGRWW